MSHKTEIAEAIANAMRARLHRTLGDDATITGEQAVKLMANEAHEILMRNKFDPFDVADILTEAQRQLRTQAVERELGQISLGRLVRDARERGELPPAKLGEKPAPVEEPNWDSETGFVVPSSFEAASGEDAVPAEIEPHPSNALSVGDAAEMLDVSRAFVLKLIDDGRLKCHMNIGRQYVQMDDVQALKQELLTNSEDDADLVPLIQPAKK